jgi:hypothetical protein
MSTSPFHPPVQTLFLQHAAADDIVEGHLPIWRVDDAGRFSSVRSIPMKVGGVAIVAADAGSRVVASVWHGTTVQ